LMNAAFERRAKTSIDIKLLHLMLNLVMMDASAL